MSYRIKYQKEELSEAYETVINKAYVSFRKQKFIKTFRLLTCAAKMQYRLSETLVDSRPMDLFKQCSFLLFKDVDLKGEKNCVLFYDSFTWDNRGLTQQYLDAILFQTNINVVFVNENKRNPISIHIYEMLERKCATIYELGQETGTLEKINKLREIIIHHRPSRAFFHLTPHSFIPFVSFSGLSGIKKYQINLTDHAYWLGDASFFDYSLEFREEGCNLTLKRGFRKEQILYLPYYPWPETDSFKGFPVNADGKIKLFSGGALYKLEGGDDMYFAILKRILEDNPNVLFLYAGDGDRTHFNNFISANKYEQRVYLLGNRSDISDVFKNIDIYLGTYPFGGGLMSQYAAVNGKPLLLYKNKAIDEIVCNKRQGSITYENADDLVIEANRLISDKDYYKKKSNYYKSLVIDRDDFRCLFIKVIDGHSPKEWKERLVEIPNKENLSRINKNGYEMDYLLLPHASFLLRMKVAINIMLSIPYYLRRISYYVKRKVFNKK